MTTAAQSQVQHQSQSAAGGQTVAVFGAAGHTGRFMVAELLRRGFVPVAIGRDGAKLAALGYAERGVEMRTASIDDAASLDRALAGVAAVINVAGPFLDTGEPVAAAALRAGIHYLDVTAEQASAQATFDTFDAAARQAGVAVIPAMGFYGGFADLLATAALGDWAAADEIRVGIALDSWQPTVGTRLTGQRNNLPRVVIENGQVVPLALPAPQSFWDFPAPFGRQDTTEVPFSEVPVIGRHVRVSQLRTQLNNTPLKDLRDASTPPPVAADDSGRSAQAFMVDVVVRQGTQTRRVVAQGRDIYAFTAPLVVEAVVRIFGGQLRGAGAQAPGEAFDAMAFLQALAQEHLTLEFSSYRD